MKEKQPLEQPIEEDEEEVNKHPSFFCSYRFVFTLVGFIMFILIYAQRVGMSVAIVCMVNHTAVAQVDGPAGGLNTTLVGREGFNTTSTAENKMACSDIVAANQTDGEFVWSKTIQGHILGAFFYGYTVSQIPAGLLAERFGGKWVLFGFLGMASLSTLFTPLAARFSLVLLVILRVLVGIGSGALFSAMHAMLGQWSPPLERSRMAGVVYAGGMMGNVVGLPVSGVLCERGFDSGWGSIFYVFGGLSVLILLVWAVFTSNTPATNKFMGRSEKRFITNCLKGVVSEEKIPLFQMPWLKFLTSGPVWSLIIANFCMDWGFYTLLTNIPTFYKEVLKFDITSNGLYSALPFIAMWATIYISSIIADRLLNAKLLSIGTARKVFTTTGFFLPAIFLVALSFLDCTQTAIAVALLTLSVGFLGCQYSGFFINHMDIAPRYAGTLMGISNGLAAVSGFIAPVVAASLTTNQDRKSWQIVFFISAAIFVFGGVIYLILGSGILQPWAKDKTTNIAEVRMEDTKLTDEPKS